MAGYTRGVCKVLWGAQQSLRHLFTGLVTSGGAAPPVRVGRAVVVRDARPRAAAFIRDDDDSRRPRASSACGVRGFEVEGG